MPLNETPHENFLRTPLNLVTPLTAGGPVLLNSLTDARCTVLLDLT